MRLSDCIIRLISCEGMGEVGSARYEPALLPPCPSIKVITLQGAEIIPAEITAITDRTMSLIKWTEPEPRLLLNT